MKKTSLVIVFILVFSLCLSNVAFAAYAAGSSTTLTCGSHTYSSYNSITTGSNGVIAGTHINSSPACSAGQIAVMATLQNSNFLIVLQSSWLYNSLNDCHGIYTSTGNHPANSGTFYSGGMSMGWHDVNNCYYGLSVPLSPGLTAGGSKQAGVSEETLYCKNKNGQTYGVVRQWTAEENYPDLVGAVGIDGTEGYVLSKELLNRVIPSSPEEAVSLMSNRDYIQGRIINLYSSDGTTVIGQFKAGGLIGTTIYENGITKTYKEDGTIVVVYPDGGERIIRWK